MAKEQVVPSSPPMTKTDIRELKGLVRNRFQLLDKQLNSHVAREVARVNEDIGSKQKAAVKKANEEMEALREEARVLVTKARSVIAKHEEKGLLWRSDTYKGAIPVQVSESGSFQDKSLAAQLHKATTDLQDQARNARLVMEERQLEVLEGLSAGLLESAEAKQYVRTIPTINDLLLDPTTVTKELKK